MFKSLFAVCLLVEDFEVSRKFYQNVLGLEINNTDNGFADFKLNGTSLAIFQKDAAIAMFPKEFMTIGGGAVLAFQVADLNKTIQELQESGVLLFEGPKTTSWGQKVAYILDPDKNIWEISESEKNE